MKKIRILFKVIKMCYADKITITYLISLVVCSILLTLVEPHFTFGSSIWYLFSIITTIGFGDVVAVTIIGKIISIFIGIYSIFMVALITGIIVNSFNEFVKAKHNESLLSLLDDFENLDKLSKSELRDISKKVKKFKKKK